MNAKYGNEFVEHFIYQIDWPILTDFDRLALVVDLEVYGLPEA